MDQKKRTSKTKITLSIARIAGPALTVLILTENPLANPNLYQEQSPVVVYLNGFVLFVAGLSIVQCHNVWLLTGNFRITTLLVTIIGWGSLLLGSSRMLLPEFWAEKSREMHFKFDGNDNDLKSRLEILLLKENVVLLLWESFLLVVGLFLTFEAYIGTLSKVQSHEKKYKNI